jgi:hypothetical protein
MYLCDTNAILLNKILEKPLAKREVVAYYWLWSKVV